MKLAGIVFVIGSSVSIGMGIARSVRRQTEVLRQLMTALQLMRSEIEMYNAPLPQAFALMAASVSSPMDHVFSLAAQEMNRDRSCTPLDALRFGLAQERELAFSPVYGVLAELGASLGKYDSAAQCRAISLAVLRLQEEIRKAEREQGVRCKTVQTLGICTGISLVILLL